MNDSHLTDEEIVKKVLDGDKEKFGILMERYQSKLIRYGKKFLVDKDNIDDVVQDVFIKAYKNLQSFDLNQRFSPWVYRIAHNTYINAIKKISLNPLTYFDFDTLLSHTIVEDPIIKEREQIEIKKIIDKALSNIEEKYREILILYYIEELSYKEIADILRIPISTVGVRIMRAKSVLKNQFSDLKIDI